MMLCAGLYSEARASLKVALGRMAAATRSRIRAVVAADVDRRALDRGELRDDRLPRRRRAARRAARSARPASAIVGLRRPAPAPSRARGRSGCRGCRARRRRATASGSPRARRPVARSSVVAEQPARAALPVVLGEQLERRREREELAERVPAQVVLARGTAGRAWAPSRRRRSRTGRRRAISGTIESIFALVPSSRIGNRSVR